MGNGDNRSTRKVRQRKSWRRKKLRDAAKKAAGIAEKAGGAKKKAAPAGSTVRRATPTAETRA